MSRLLYRVPGFCLFFIFSIVLQAQKNQPIQGTWVGTFTFNSGTQYAMQLEITQADKKSFTGTAIWPDYFNSGSDISGTIRKDELTFRETRIAQGLEMDLSYIYQMQLENKTLQGSAMEEGQKPLARFELQLLSSLSNKQQKEWQDLLDVQKEKFGEAILLDEFSLSEGQKIYDHYLKTNAFDENIANMVIHGEMKLNEMTFPIYGVFKQNNQYIELTFQQQQFIRAKNDSLEWEYNPANDQVTVKKIDSSDDDAADNFFGTGDLNPEHEVKLAHRAIINGKSGARLLMSEDDLLVVYIADNTVARIEKKEEIMDFDNFRLLDQMNFPTRFHQVSNTNNTTMDMDSILFNAEIDESIFLLSDELRAKISFTDDHDQLNDKGNQHFENGEYETALDLYNQAIAKNSNNYIYFYNRGSAHLELGHNYETITDMGRSIELNDDYAAAWNKRGLAKYNLGDYKNALTDYKQAVNLDSNFEDAWTNIGLAAYHLEDYETAAGTFQKLTEMKPEKGLYHYNKAYTFYQMGNDSLAAQAFASAIDNGYDGAEAYNMLGVVQYRSEDYKEAISNFKAAIKLDQENAMYHLNLGKSFYNLDDFDQAKPEINLSLELNPDSEDALNYLGLSYFGDKDFPTAIAFFTKAIDINDGNAVYFDNRAYAKAAMMNYTGAIEDFNESINLYSKDAEIYYQRGLMNMNLNNRFDACKDFSKARELGHKTVAKAIEENCDFLKSNDE